MKERKKERFVSSKAKGGEVGFCVVEKLPEFSRSLCLGLDLRSIPK